jgi:NTP pyrophosphatase (non-canonical NTP hydrolase)
MRPGDPVHYVDTPGQEPSPGVVTSLLGSIWATVRLDADGSEVQARIGGSNLVSPLGGFCIPMDKLTHISAGAAASILQNVCHGSAVAGGWWHDPATGEPRTEFNVPEKLCLVHSEISEAMEGHRKNLQDDKLPHRKMIEVELADAVIRICDLAGALKLDLGGAITEKLAFNATRVDHTAAARLAAGGKAY